MGRKKKEVVEEKKVVKKEDISDSICPTCGPKGDIINDKCRLCGARKTINDVSGNVIWMRNGKLIRAFLDSKRAYITMANAYNVPKDQWPEEFLK